MMTLPETATPPTITRRVGTITRSSIINNRNSNNNINNNFPAVPLTEAVSSYQQQQQQQRSSSSSPASSSRLLSIAKYTSFHPYNIACSDPIVDSNFTTSNSNSNTCTTQPNKNDEAKTVTRTKMKSSLGAIAGSMGIALFHLSKPRIPIMVFNNYHHHTGRKDELSSTSTSKSQGYYLAFQPTTTTSNNLLLASAYGTGILLWDVSGHTINPLWGRVRVDTFTVSSSNSSSYDGTLSITGITNCHKNRITSLGWKHTINGGSSILSSSSTNSLLYATTISSAFLWDIRMSTGSSTGSTSSNSLSMSTTSCRPCLRFGYSGTGIHNNNNNNNRSNSNTTTSSSYFVSMACSLVNDECAVLDSSGIVRVYDPRMIGQIQQQHTNNRERYCVDVFQAHDKLGAGIVYMPITSKTATSTTTVGDTTNSNSSSSIQNSWITWGLDTNDTIVRHNDNNYVGATSSDIGNNNNTSRSQKTIVKVWRKQKTGGTSTDDATTTINNNKNTEQFSDKSVVSSSTPLSSYQVIAQHQSNTNISIACARVCPSISNTFVTIGFTMRGNNISYRANTYNNNNRTKNSSVPSWYADIWQLQSTTTAQVATNDDTTYTKSDSNNVNLNLHKLASITNHTTTTPPTTTVSTASNSYRTNSRLRGGSVGSIFERNINNNTRSYNDNNGITTGTSTSTNSNKDVLSIANQDQDGIGIGMLCAVEIGYSSYQTIPSGLVNHNSSTTINNDTSNLVQVQEDGGLVLCCLSDNGYITTHALPEACDPVKRQEQQKQRRLRRIEFRKKQQLQQQEQLRQLREEQQKQQATASMSLTSINNVVDTVSTQSIQNLNESVDGNIGTMTMPFDMDLSYTSNSNNDKNRNIDDSISKTEVSGVSESQLITIDNTESDTNRERRTNVDSKQSTTNDKQDTVQFQQQHYIPSSVFMARIDTDRIPCPRLCSATFSPGVGGLAGFHNGHVQKMWQLLEKKDMSTLSIVLASDTTKPESHNEKNTLRIPTDASSSNHTYPRTMKDMASMVKAATELQLSKQNVLEVPFSGFGDGDVHMNQGLYQTLDSSMKPHDIDNNQSAGLNHGVKLSFPFDSYGRQIELALRWKLGDITNGLQATTSISNTEKTRPVVDTSSSSIGSRLNLPMIPTTGRQQPTALQQEILERHHPFTSTSRKADTPEFFKSNFAPGLQRINSTGHLRPKTVTLKPTTGTDLDHERGVHAGEYSNSPTQHESLLFLRKFGKNQQEDIFIDNFLGNEALKKENMQNTSTRMKYRDTTSPSKLSVAVDTQQSPNVGVYALRIQVKQEEYKFELQRFLLNAKGACDHNADVCRSLEENEKTEVWEVLGDIVQTQLENTTCHDYDGWSTTMRSGALGRGLVESFLQYYQSIGDVQMLATIVCILRSHIYRNIAQSASATGLKGHNIIESLLPDNDDDDAKYDSYIRHYADLLYGWGLLNIRAELCKHLFHTATPLPEEYWQKSTSSGTVGAHDDTVNANTTNNNTNKPGIALIFQCPQCDGDTDIGTNFCRSCKDYAFRCSICDMSVRGLFTVCDLCGHGGHVQHIKDWFALNNACPTGCGCMCVISSLSSAVANTTQSETIPTGVLV